jgi:hypothetical protein
METFRFRQIAPSPAGSFRYHITFELRATGVYQAYVDLTAKAGGLGPASIRFLLANPAEWWKKQRCNLNRCGAPTGGISSVKQCAF